MSEILHIENHNEFKTYINSGRSILVDFYAEWCGPCKLLAPRLEELRFKYPNVLIIKVDVDKAEEICNEYSITSMPTVIGFNNRNIIETVFGFNDTKITELMEKLESLFSNFNEQSQGFNTTIEYPSFNDIQINANTKEKENPGSYEMMKGGSNPIALKTEVSNNALIHGQNLNYVYLSAKLSEMIQNYQRIVISVETRDQGWASVSDSNSFFDLRITDCNNNLLAEKNRIIENYRESDYKMKTFILNRNDSTLGQFLNSNNNIILVARSQYPGWENYIKSAKFIFE